MGPEHPDDSVPNVARAYDYALGGAQNFAVDRELVDAMVVDWPELISSSRANRSFLRHAVHTALDRGIRQFLDLGSGIPTVGNVHEIALARDPAARVAYVDNEAVAVAHSRNLLAGVAGATVTQRDLRDVDGVLAAPEVAGLLDLTRPVAVLMVSVLHFVADDDDPAGILAAYRRALAPGSLLALSHASDTYHPAAAARVDATRTPVHRRDAERLATLLAPFGVAAADLADVGRWAQDTPAGPLGLLAVVSDPL